MRTKIVKQAQTWLGRRESDGSHKLIIDAYNQIKPLPRGYKVQYNDEWCATFVSAVAYVCGALDVVPAECSCSKMIEHFKSLGSWKEDDSYVPQPGDIMFYDWQDNGKGDNTGNPDHVGIVEQVSSGTITVIEGNKNEAVARRYLQVNGRYIRGYGIPKYKTTTTTTNKTTSNGVKTVNITMTQLSQGATGPQVKTLQRLLLALGYKMKDGWKTYGVDGSFGTATKNAVIAFQKAKGLTQDGIVGEKTWNALLK